MNMDNPVGALQAGLGNNQLSRKQHIPKLIQTSDNHPLKAKQISCAESYSVVIDLEDNVWVFGSNGNGSYSQHSCEYYN